MDTKPPQIVAFGGGGFSMESENPLLDEFVLARTGAERPRVCFLPTASGDADHYLVRFYNAFRERTEPSHISLFRRERGVGDIRDHLLSQDVIYVGGGSVVSLLGVWRAHGIERHLRDAWEAGVVMCGLSAGSLCWFEQAISGYQGETRVVDGLGFLPYANAVHWDAATKSGRRKLLLDGDLTGFAAEDGAALHFVGTDLAQAISSRRNSRAYRVESRDGRPRETQLATRYLGCERSVPLVPPGPVSASAQPRLVPIERRPGDRPAVAG